MKRISCISILLFCTFTLFANLELNEDNIGQQRDLSENLSFYPDDYSDSWATYDDNKDGLIDHAKLVDEQGRLIYEVFDFNKNGFMDDFYFFHEGSFIREEIDQNNDLKIDLWVYITEGVYVLGYEVDKNFDGRIDKIRIFDGE